MIPRIALFVLAVSCAAASPMGSIAGTVRDAAGNPVAGAKLTVACSPDSPVTTQAMSDSSGAYQVVDPGTGECAVSIQSAGFVTPAKRVIHMPSGSPSLTVDFVLTRGTPKFEAAGIRGLIDPGGYSAPANAAAASGLVQGVAEIERAGNAGGREAASAFSCASEPELKQAAAWIANRQFDSARTLLLALGDHKNARVHTLLAQAEEGLGQFGQASDEYQIAAALAPTRQNLFGVGYELILAGSPGKAIKAFEDGLARTPNSKLLIGLGTAQFLDGKGAQAVHSFLQAAALEPSDPRPYPFLVKAFVISGAEANAVRGSLKRFLDLAPGNAQACYLYAVVLLHNGIDEDLSRSLLTRAIELEPRLSDAHAELAGMCARRGDKDCAVRNYEAAVRLTPDRAELHYKLAMAYRQTGQVEAASKELDEFKRMRAGERDSRGATAIELGKFISVLATPASPGNEVVPCLPRESK